MLIGGIVACLVARRQPGNRTGWLLAGKCVGSLSTLADAWGG